MRPEQFRFSTRAGEKKQPIDFSRLDIASAAIV
jgi:hypothetical protein